ERAKKLQNRLGARDNEKLDEYFTAVRGCEEQLRKAKAWALREKPKVEMKQPQDFTDKKDLIGPLRLTYDLIHLALQTDSTRAVTLDLSDTVQVPPIPGVELTPHPLSHHGGDSKRLAQLALIEKEQLRALSDFLVKLKDTKEEGETLL